MLGSTGSHFMNRSIYHLIAIFAASAVFAPSVPASVTDTVSAILRDRNGTQTGEIFDIVDSRDGSKRYFLSTFPSIDSDSSPNPSLLRQVGTSTPESVLPLEVDVVPGKRRIATDHSGRFVCFTSQSEVLDFAFAPIGGHPYFIDTETDETRQLNPVVNGLFSTRYLAGLSGDGKSALVAGYLNRDRFYLMNTSTGTGKEVLKTGNASNVISALRLVPDLPSAVFVSTSSFFGGSTTRQAVVYADLNTGAYEVLNIASPGATVTTEASIQDVKVSDDGRFVTFSSTAAYVLADTNNKRDVYLFDRNSDSLSRVSVSTSGAQLSLDTVAWDMSADGSKIAFTTDSNTSSIFVRNIETGVVSTLLSNYGADPITWSKDGVHLYLYKQDEYNGEKKWWLSPSMPYRFNTTTKTTQTLIKPNANTLEGAYFDNDEVDLAPSGESAVFVSRSSDYDRAVEGPRTQSAFWLDLTTRKALRMSKALLGQENGWSHSVNISADGRFATFASSSSNLVPGTPASINGFLYVYTRSKARLKVLDLPDDLLYAAKPKISADGKYVIFIGGYVHQPSGRLANGIFIWNPDSGAFKRVNNDVGLNVFYDIQNLHISADGSLAYFDATGRASSTRRIVRLDVFRGRTTILPSLYEPVDNQLISMSRNADVLLISYGTTPSLKFAVVGPAGQEIENLSTPALRDGVYLDGSQEMSKARVSSDGRYVTLYSQIAVPGFRSGTIFQTFYDISSRTLQVNNQSGFEYSSVEDKGRTAISAFGGKKITLDGKNDFLITQTPTGLAAARLGTPQADLQYRFRYAGRAWSTWSSSNQAPSPESNANGNYRIEGQVRTATVESPIYRFTLQR